MSVQFDPEVLQDFLTESGELLDELDTDLVALESAPDDPELTNKAFRALHTIKGSASFLALTELVEVAHAAEDALNAARKGETTIDRRFMDLILEAVDVVRRHMEQLELGEPLEKAPADLVESLRQLGSGSDSQPAAQPPASPPSDAPQPPAAQPGASSSTGAAAAVNGETLDLPQSKAELLEFMIEDLRQSLDHLLVPIEKLRDDKARPEAGRDIVDLCEGLARTTDFFEFAQMAQLVELLGLAGEKAEELRAQDAAQLVPRLQGVVELLRLQADALEQRRILRFHIDTLSGRIADLVLGNSVDEAATLPDDADWKTALQVDNVPLPESAVDDRRPAARGAEQAPAQPAGEPAAPPARSADAAPASQKTKPSPQAEPSKQPSSPSRKSAEQTIRVEVDRLESLQNLVGELVLQKNRISALARAVTLVEGLNQEMREAINQSTGDLDRVTGDIQVAVMRTRMQPLDKLFGRYPRLIRDLARKTNKKIELVVEGGDTEVDKSVLEALGDPLVHLLRNAADHGIEPPERRVEAGKPESGTIWLSAGHEGGSVRVLIRDDGAGLRREKIAQKAVERGLISEEEVASLSDKQVYRFIFAPGFSTAEQVSDLSGRGVGMDVVRTNIENVKGHIDIDSEEGKGTTVSILIPLTVAIMPAMMVAVGAELYAVPLSNILQIVRPEDEQVSTVQGQKVMRLRGDVIPLVSMAELFHTDLEAAGEQERFALIVTHNEQQVGLLVSNLLGQQEIVIKPLDEKYKGEGPVSGATVRDDGGVSLIVDVGKVVMQASSSTRLAAAA
ncbi:MAG: chemotaxis protein CheA [Planctomycetota bacterium]|nr:MAG: chemotaxis protein CheA [Planctomycetota bacterium]